LAVLSMLYKKKLKVKSKYLHEKKVITNYVYVLINYIFQVGYKKESGIGIVWVVLLSKVDSVWSVWSSILYL